VRGRFGGEAAQLGRRELEDDAEDLDELRLRAGGARQVRVGAAVEGGAGGNGGRTRISGRSRNWRTTLRRYSYEMASSALPFGLGTMGWPGVDALAVADGGVTSGGDTSEVVEPCAACEPEGCEGCENVPK